MSLHSNSGNQNGENPNVSVSPMRLGEVELDSVGMTRNPELDESADFKEMSNRLEVSEQIFENLKNRSDFHLEALLTQTLNYMVDSGPLDGLLIASSEGFVIAQSAGMAKPVSVAAIGALCETIMRRVESERLILPVKELVLNGVRGDTLVVRLVEQAGVNRFLVAWSRTPCRYKLYLDRAEELCGKLLGLGGKPNKAEVLRLVTQVSGLWRRTAWLWTGAAILTAAVSCYPRFQVFAGLSGVFLAGIGWSRVPGSYKVNRLLILCAGLLSHLMMTYGIKLLGDSFK